MSSGSGAGLFCLVAFSAFAQTDEARLAAGEVLVTTTAVEDFPIPQAQVRGVVDAPPSEVWKLVDDCGNYRRTMPRIADSQEEKREGNVVICRVVADLPFPFSDLTSRTRAVHSVEPGKRYERAWEMIEGSDYLFNRGGFVLVPWGEGGQRTLVTYRALARPKMSLPKFLLEAARRRSLPQIIHRLRELTAKR